MSRLRIVQIVPSLVVGGAERMATWLAQAQLDAGHDVHLLTVKDRGPLFHTLSPALRRRVWTCGKASRYDVRALPRLVGALQDLRPDVVHTHLFTALSWGTVAAKIVGVPAVVHTQHAVHDDDHAVVPYVRRGLAPAVDAIVGCNAATTHDVRRRGWARGTVTATIDNGLPLTDRPVHRPHDGAFVVGTVGRLVPVKGQRHLIDAIATLRERGEEVRCVILGDGPERDALRRQAEARGIAGEVHMPGAVHDVAHRLTAFDLFCLPSLSEAMPMTLLEAAAAALPLLVTDVGGAPTLIDAGAGGWVVPPADPPALAQAISEAMHMPRDARRAMGVRSREIVHARYDIRATAKAYERVYRQALARRSAADAGSEAEA